MKIEKSGLAAIIPDWPAPKNVHAMTTSRVGGVSTGVFASLNLGAHVGDDTEAVQQNRHLIESTWSLPSPPVWLEQVHGTDVMELEQHAESTTLVPVADGSITSAAGVVCCVMTADCLPLFLCDGKGEQIAVVHVGWRGLAQGIVKQAVDCFNAAPAELIAWSGPAISVRHFEVGEEVKQQLGGDAAAWRKSTRPGKFYADLYRLVGQQAKCLGVGWYGHADACTFQQEEFYFSHRRDGNSGRLASLIYKT